MAKYPSTILPQSNDPKEIQRAVLDLLDKINEISRDAVIAKPGMIASFGTTVEPDDGWLLCDGASYSRDQYRRLFAEIGTTFGSTDSKHFNVPDMREVAPVGAGTRGAGVTAHDVFALGEFKDDQMQGHKHTQRYSVVANRSAGAQNWYSPAGSTNDGADTTVPVTDGVNGVPRTGTVTRGKRIGLNFYIKT